jgi:glycosyltransferase involved in cell wall biosynthesis
MPVYNAAPFLIDSITSILNQSYTNFIFIIINDGSTDDSEKIILSFDDKRIHYLKNDSNQGLIYTLNRGINIIESEYIARMDADDIALPSRLEKQIAFMNTDSDIGVCGAQIAYFGKDTSISNFPLEHNELKAKLVFAPGINHPTAFIRTSVIKKNKLQFDAKYLVIEDYEFWIRFSKFGKMANLPEVLLKYRWEGQNITAKNWSWRENRYKLVYEIILSELQIPITEENLVRHLEFAFNTKKIRDINGLIEHKRLLLKQNKALKIYPEKEFDVVIENAWKKLFYKFVENNFKTTIKYFLHNKYISFSQLRYFLSYNFTKKMEKR